MPDSTTVGPYDFLPKIVLALALGSATLFKREIGYSRLLFVDKTRYGVLAKMAGSSVAELRTGAALLERRKRLRVKKPYLLAIAR